MLTDMRDRPTRRLGVLAATAVLAAAPLSLVTATSASAAPAYSTPLPCGYSANANTRSNHSPAAAIDLQGGDINGQPVLAAAAGTVSRVADEGSTSYGKWVEVDHGGGATTRYAHLSSQSVSVGQAVQTGTQLGTVGNTGGSQGPHLHFEAREGGTSVQTSLDGTSIAYPGNTSVRSNNCGGGGGTQPAPNPYTPTQVCGAGFSEIDSRPLGEEGRVHLLYNAGTGENCVTTIKARNVGTASAASAFLEVQGDFASYAGPVKATASQTCVRWGGSLADASFESPFEHCG